MTEEEMARLVRLLLAVGLSDFDSETGEMTFRPAPRERKVKVQDWWGVRLPPDWLER